MDGAADCATVDATGPDSGASACDWTENEAQQNDEQRGSSFLHYGNVILRQPTAGKENEKVWSNPVLDFCPMGVFGLKWP
jgi:hypothetical protein